MPKISDEKKKNNKVHLQLVARELFKSKGYAKTSVNDIVREAKVSKGSFYTYYDSKESLFFEIINDVDRKIIHHGRDLVEKNNKQLLSDYIEYRLTKYMQEHNKIRIKYTFEFWSSTTLTPEQTDLLKKRYMEFEEDILRVIELGQKRNFYRKDVDTKSIIHILLATIDGLILSDAVLYRDINMEVIQTTIDMFNVYLEKRN